jgi:hypothetical protein
VRVPDPFLREATATYQSKLVFNVTGVNGTAVNATTDAGRFCYVFNPIITDAAPSFSAGSPQMQVAFKDGTDVARLWTDPFAAPGALNFDTYILDPENNTFANINNTGLMQKMRPVSMSVLASYNGNLVAGGGNIAAALLPGGSWESHLVNGTAGFQYSNWEQLARQPGAYDGPLSKGAYTFWLPDDSDDYLLSSVNATSTTRTLEKDYPLLVVSGQVSPPAGGILGGTVLRLDVYINYEYTTDSRVVETRHGPKSLAERTESVARLLTEPTSMPNDDHINWLKVLLGGAAGFLVGGPVGAVLGASAGAGLSLASAIR